MHGGKSTVEMGFCSLHRRKRTRVDLTPLDGHSGQMRCKTHKECRLRTETETVVCALHNRKRNINQMKEVRKGIFECLPQFPCRGQFNEASGVQSHASGQHPHHAVPQKGSRPQHVAGETHVPTFGGVTWAPTTNRGKNVVAAGSSDWAQVDHKRWCARHGKLTSQCELMKDCYYVCYDSSVCLSTPLEMSSDLLAKGCKELLCSRHNALRLVDFLERAPDKMSYHCIAGHRCLGVLGVHHETLPGQEIQPAREVVSSFFL